MDLQLKGFTRLKSKHWPDGIPFVELLELGDLFQANMVIGRFQFLVIFRTEALSSRGHLHFLATWPSP